MAGWWQRLGAKLRRADASSAAIAATGTGAPVQAPSPAAVQAPAAEIEDEVASQTEPEQTDG
jgi:hypothetical protein